MILLNQHTNNKTNNKLKKGVLPFFLYQKPHRILVQQESNPCPDSGSLESQPLDNTFLGKYLRKKGFLIFAFASIYTYSSLKCKDHILGI